jgi:Cu(I)/Ag(I) efflux system membrane protein CusA/SilA
MLDACREEVGPPLFFSLLIITVSFLPVFTLESQEGRLFAPLAYTKTFSMAGAALLSGDAGAGADAAVHPRQDHAGDAQPGEPLPDLALPSHHRGRDAVKKLTICLRLLAAGWRRYYPGVRAWAAEFMPTLTKARCSYMPASLPGMSITKAGGAAADAGQDHQELPRSQPRSTARRDAANTATDPAPRDVRDGDQPQAESHGGPA